MSVATIEHINPANLTIDINVRKDANLTPDFLASIKEHGVIQPVVAHRTGGNTAHVLMGQRRTLAAVENQLESIPVYLVDTLEEADRLAQQIVENDQRQELTDADRADAYHQMSLLGISPETIARRTGATTERVSKALTARSNAEATKALEYGMTIEQAAIVEELSAYPEAVQKLTICAENNPANFEHVAQQLRNDIETNATIAQMTAEATEAGLTVLGNEVFYYDYRGPAAKLSELTHPDGSPLTEDDADAVAISNGYSGIKAVKIVADWKARGFHKGDKAPTGMTKEQKADRAALIANNKAMDAAILVRQEFVKTFLQAKKMPKDAQGFIAWTLAHSSNRVNHALARQGEAAKLMGNENESGELRNYLGRPGANPEKATLALMISAYEVTCDRQDWRHPMTDMATYLTTLETWGYQVSEVERIIIDNISK